MKNEPFTIEPTYNAPVMQVWNALTNKDEMKQWYFDVPAFKPVVGCEFTFTGKGSKGEEYIHLCKVTEVIPGKKIAYTWQYEGYPGGSEVMFELFDEGSKTKLKLTHSGLETFAAGNPDFAKESFAGGWNHFVNNALPKYLEAQTGQ